MRFSSSIKVGILTVTALFILIFSIMWVKGRSLSSSERITVEFKDVNGMRPGSAVQIMGYRVGQVEDVIPLINGDDSFVKLKFVITEPNIDIPYGSEISIQQSGLIGEQFLEITPPKNRILYLPLTGKERILKKGNDVEMLLSDDYHKIGKVKNVEIVQTSSFPADEKVKYSTEKDFKITAYFNDSDNHIYRITGKVPKKISSNSLVTAKMHIVYPDEEYDSKPHNWQPLAEVYKLDCICIDEE